MLKIWLIAKCGDVLETKFIGCNKMSDIDIKIIELDDFNIIRDKFKEQHKKTILCHGVYDLVHYGHIEHLKEAKSLGDILIVSITAAKYVNKGPGRPYFTDEQRMNFIASLEMVDYVILSESTTANKIIETVQPDLYVKGEEYSLSENDITANIDSEVEEVKKYGGDAYFTRGQVFSSTKLINNFFGVLPNGVLDSAKKLKEKYTLNDIKAYVDSFEDCKILVVGDIIIDEYIFCNVQGLMSKDRALSSRYKSIERYPGGVLAVAGHLSSLCNSVTVCSIIGNESHLHTQILDQLSGKMFLDLCFPKNYNTIVKQRFLEKHKIRNTYDKLFSVNYLPSYSEILDINKEDFYSKLEKTISKYDLVIVCDYGHGLIDEKAKDILENKSNFLAVNCQTNSSNYGNNIITKYKRADTFVLDEREIELAFSSSYKDKKELLKALKNQLKSNMGWLTIGAEGAIGIDKSGIQITSPALTLDVIDTIGAGDAFYAISSLSAFKNLPIEVATLLGNIAGAIKVHNIGNSKFIDKVSVLKFVSTVLNV